MQPTARVPQKSENKADRAPPDGRLVETALAESIRRWGNRGLGDLLRPMTATRQPTIAQFGSGPPSAQSQSAPTTRQPVTQPHNAADARLPANRIEALNLARESKQYIDAINGQLASATQPRRRNVPEFVSQERITLVALTPRHDSPLTRSSMLFFAGQTDYSDSVELPSDATHRVDVGRRRAQIRARRDDNVHESLSGPQIEERLVQAVSELADLMSSPRGGPKSFERYQAQFNSLWDTTQFAAWSTSFDSNLDSRGPRNRKAREIFEYIYYRDLQFRRAYDNDRNGIRERIDTYYGPDSFNATISPRLHGLGEVFFSVRAPVPDTAYPSFRAAVAMAATLLDDADRKAVDHSNLWQGLINAHVRTDERRADIRTLIRTPPASSVPRLPWASMSHADPQAHFVATWDAEIKYRAGTKPILFEAGQSVVRYYGGAQRFHLRTFLPKGATNPGLTLYVTTRVKRAGKVILEPGTLTPFLPDANHTPELQIAIPALEPTPAGGDALTVEVELVAADRSTVLTSKTIDVNVLPEQTYSPEQAMKQATADEQYLADLLVKMKAMGGMQAAAAAAITASGDSKIILRPMTQRHDSREYVTAVKGGPHPELIGYFMGTTYGDPPDATNSFAFPPVAGVYRPNAAPRCILVNVTYDVAARLRRSEAALIRVIVHTAVPRMNPYGSSTLERYMAEFRALWMDEDFNEDTAFDPGRTQGPKSQRAGEIFDYLYGYNSKIRDAYNNDIKFRMAVDDYAVPDGVNLIVSPRLGQLLELIESFSGRDFESFSASVQGYMGKGPSPLDGVLSDAERNEVKGNRAWRNLVERKIRNPRQRQQIKLILQIPI